MSNLINISIDDVSPHPSASLEVLKNCFKLIGTFPDIKFTLFVPISYWRTVRQDVATPWPLRIDLFTDFCDELRTLPVNNFEVGYHGFHHGIPGKSDNDELEKISYEDSHKLIDLSLEVIKRANLQGIFKPIIRPPAWRMSPHAIRAFRERGFNVLALTDEAPWCDSYGGEHEKNNDVVYVTASPPFRPLQILPKMEVVYHACEWDKNYLSTEMTCQLEQFIRSHDSLKFCFIEDLL